MPVPVPVPVPVLVPVPVVIYAHWGGAEGTLCTINIEQLHDFKYKTYFVLYLRIFFYPFLSILISGIITTYRENIQILAASLFCV
jgi:hypothetical protein